MIDFDTHATDGDPAQIISAVDHVRRQHDANTLLKMMADISQQPAVVWGENVIGFGAYSYSYKTGRQGQWPQLAFCPSLENITIHVMSGLGPYEAQIKKIGRIKYSQTQLILHKFSDIQLPALNTLLKQIYADAQAT